MQLKRERLQGTSLPFRKSSIKAWVVRASHSFGERAGFTGKSRRRAGNPLRGEGSKKGISSRRSNGMHNAYRLFLRFCLLSSSIIHVLVGHQVALDLGWATHTDISAEILRVSKLCSQKKVLFLLPFLCIPFCVGQLCYTHLYAWTTMCMHVA